jgi:Polysaccharide lyase family 4, domain II
LAFGAVVALVTVATPLARAASYQSVAVTNGGKIAGVVKFAGAVPPVAPIKTTKDLKDCGTTIPNPLYEVGGGGGLANVEVFIKDISKGKPKPTQAISLMNTGCMFRPRVQGACVGQQLTIGSADACLHTTHVLNVDTNVTLLNVAIPFKGITVVKSLAAEASTLQVKCDAHEWMRAWVLEFDHPYFASTGADGRFEIGDVPPGTYTVVAWHEVMGKKIGNVTVSPGKASTADFQFTAK